MSRATEFLASRGLLNESKISSDKKWEYNPSDAKFKPGDLIFGETGAGPMVGLVRADHKGVYAKKALMDDQHAEGYHVFKKGTIIYDTIDLREGWINRKEQSNSTIATDEQIMKDISFAYIGKKELIQNPRLNKIMKKMAPQWNGSMYTWYKYGIGSNK
jgi:hypothetical protein